MQGEVKRRPGQLRIITGPVLCTLLTVVQPQVGAHTLRSAVLSPLSITNTVQEIIGTGLLVQECVQRKEDSLSCVQYLATSKNEMQVGKSNSSAGGVAPSTEGKTSFMNSLLYFPILAAPSTPRHLVA